MKNSRSSILRVIICLIIPFALVFCNSPKKETDQASESTQAADVEKQLDQIQHELDSTWNRLIGSDDKKMANMRTVIDEYRLYLPQGTDSLALDSLYKTLEQLPELRPTRQTMARSDLITQYDNVTTDLIEKIKQTREIYPDLQKYQRIQLFLDDIQEADDSVIFYRRDYDIQADKFNRIIEKKQPELKNSSKYSQQKTLPIFRLIP